MDWLVAVMIAVTPSLVALVVLGVRSRGVLLAALIGGGGWLLALLLRTPILAAVSGRGLQAAIAASILAGIFEESARFLLLRALIASSSGGLKQAVGLGLGWGEAEAVLLYVVPVALLGRGYSILDLLPGAIERNSAILIHTSLSIIVYRSLPSLRVLGLAVAIHSAVNAVAVLLLYVLSNVWLVELAIAAIATALFFYAARPAVGFILSVGMQ